MILMTKIKYKMQDYYQTILEKVKDQLKMVDTVLDFKKTNMQIQA